MGWKQAQTQTEITSHRLIPRRQSSHTHTRKTHAQPDPTTPPYGVEKLLPPEAEPPVHHGRPTKPHRCPLTCPTVPSSPPAHHVSIHLAAVEDIKTKHPWGENLKAKHAHELLSGECTAWCFQHCDKTISLLNVDLASRMFRLRPH